MAKRKGRSKRSMGRLPKGLPVRNPQTLAVNPFEVTQRQKRPKYEVHNRSSSSKPSRPTALAEALQKRKAAVQASLQSSKKANVFSDKRIGEYDRQMTAEEQNLARLVRERSRRSKRVSKYSLDDDNDDNGGGGDVVLTHKGKAIDKLTAADHVILSDDEEDYGNLDAMDTSLHFGGGRSSSSSLRSSMYGPAGDLSAQDMAQVYASRKNDLDDLILRRKILKAERLKSKEEQVEAFTSMDESFQELATLLSFRDKEKDIREHLEHKRAGTLSKDDQEMADWDREMKQYQFLERKVKATDRTKTPEEIVREEAERLHELETRRLARMNGDFEDDELSDISDDNDGIKTKKRKKGRDHPEALDESDDEESVDALTTRFTEDGLVQVDKNGLVVKKVGGDDEKKRDSASPANVLKAGTRVSASYHAKEQFDGREVWYDGVISSVHKTPHGSITYNVDYDDGDFEEGIEPRHVRPIEMSKQEVEKEATKKAEEDILKRKRQKARVKARAEIPFVFEVPTTLDSLHDMIGSYASTGADASLIIQRIYRANSVRLDRRNIEKMQNFYDVLLRRFVAVGDAIYKSGDGGAELGRYKQLDALTETMYLMAQDSAESAAAVWSRRLGFFQNAHAKRLRDAELDIDEEEDGFHSAWPSTGVFLTLRALGHVFPVTDQRHHVVTPAVLLLGQMVAHTPVETVYDLVMGILCSGLLLEYTREAKRVAPEALAFLAGVIRLFSSNPASICDSFPLPSLGVAARRGTFDRLRLTLSRFKGEEMPRLSLERNAVEGEETLVAVLSAALHLVVVSANDLAGSVSLAEKEVFSEIIESLLVLTPRSKARPLPQGVQRTIAAAINAVSQVCQLDQHRAPIQRRSTKSVRQRAIKSLAPRLENPEKYSMSKDKGKKATQAAMDRTRREYKREHKAVSRELRLDAAFVESERRNEKEKKDSAAKAKRQKAFAWLESEQAAMNQQVRQGGGLLAGGGTGAARAKAATAKLGMKRGGKL